jgi:hypothetical protein
VSAEGALVAGSTSLYYRNLNPVRPLAETLTGGAAFDPATGARRFNLPVGAALGLPEDFRDTAFGLMAGFMSSAPTRVGCSSPRAADGTGSARPSRTSAPTRW